MRSAKKQNGHPAADYSAEIAVVGSLILDPALIDRVAAIVRPDQFFAPDLGAIYGAVLGLKAAGIGIDDITILSRVKDLPEFAGRNVPAELFKTIHAVPNAAHAVYYAEVVVEHWRNRELTNVGPRANEMLLSGDSLDDVVAFYKAESDRIGATGKRRLNPITSAEFDAADWTLNYLVSNVLVEGQPFVCGGRSKTLKTKILVDLALSLGTGTPFLDTFHTQQRRVLIISGESGRATLHKTAREICYSKGIKLRDADVLWEFTLPRLAMPADVAELRSIIQCRGAKLCIIDPAYLALFTGDTRGRQASNVFDTGPLLGELTILGQDTGCTMGICHHCRKSGTEGFEPPGLEDLSMAGFAEWARQWLLLGRREQYELGSGDHKLWLSAGGSAGHCGCWALDVYEGPANGPGQYEVTVATASDAKATAKAEHKAALAAAHAEQLAETMADYPDGESLRTLAKAAKLNPPNGKAAMDLLLSAGRAEKFIATKKGKQCEHYKPVVFGA